MIKFQFATKKFYIITNGEDVLLEVSIGTSDLQTSPVHRLDELIFITSSFFVSVSFQLKLESG